MVPGDVEKLGFLVSSGGESALEAAREVVPQYR
jgi:hypothetical protein